VKNSFIFVLLVAITAPVTMVNAQDIDQEIADLRQLVEDMRQNYETRISDLETRLAVSERAATTAQRDADEAFEMAEQTAIDQSSGSSTASAFNPALGAILMGGFSDIDRSWDEIPGFQPGGEIGSGSSGFNLGEAEINLNANIDARYFGNFTIGLHEDDGAIEVELEEAWFQTSDLPAGLSVTGGRYFSSAGYLNSFHLHTDDFADRPLPYQAFFGGRYFVDGVQARWVAPTSLLFELGTELNWGDAFPGTANGTSSPSAWTAFANMGGDVGVSNSWQIGLSHISADVVDRSGAHEHDPVVPAETFTGDSDLTVVDFVWKWAPQGNTSVRSVKVQGEYFRREENGFYDGILYDGDQTGWYVQGVWQFAPLWRIGLRHDLVDADNRGLLAGTELEDPGRSSNRSSVMFDWSPSEFSRLRMQYTKDNVLPQSDDQWFLQYIMSVGAHGAHQF